MALARARPAALLLTDGAPPALANLRRNVQANGVALAQADDDEPPDVSADVAAAAQLGRLAGAACAVLTWEARQREAHARLRLHISIASCNIPF